MQIGPSTDIRLPIEAEGRNINSTDIANVLEANPYAMAMWFTEQIRLTRMLGIADMINPAGNRVSSDYEGLTAAVDDFGADPTITNFILGTVVHVSCLSLCGLDALVRRQGTKELAHGHVSSVHHPPNHYARLQESQGPHRLGLLEPDQPHRY